MLIVACWFIGLTCCIGIMFRCWLVGCFACGLVGYV